MASKPSVIVVGAGVAGLFASYRLLKRGIHVTLVEASPHLGGVVGWTQAGRAPLERFYHHVFKTDRFILDALNELNVDMTWTHTRTGFVGPGPTGVMELSAPHHLLSYSGLNWKQRLSLGAVLARVQLAWKLGSQNVESYDHLTIEEWLSKLGGKAAYQAFFDPLVRKKFGRETPTISAAWLIGRLTMRANRDRRGEILGYPPNSFRGLNEGLAKACQSMGAEIHLNEPVRGLLEHDGVVCGVKTTLGEHRGDAVISTLAPPHHEKLLLSIGHKKPAESIAELPYQGAIVTLIGLKKRLSPYYWVNVMDSDAPFGALIEQTLINPSAPYDGPTLYVAYYPNDDAPQWDMTDDEVVAEITRHLKRLFPDTMTGNSVRWSEVNRTRLAGLIYRSGLRHKLPVWRTPAPALYFTGMFKCYPKPPIDLVGSDACACSDIVAAKLLDQPEPRWTNTQLPERLNP